MDGDAGFLEHPAGDYRAVRQVDREHVGLSQARLDGVGDHGSQLDLRLGDPDSVPTTYQLLAQLEYRCEIRKTVR